MVAHRKQRSDELTFSTLVSLFKARRWFMAAATVLSGAFFCSASFLLQTTYRATAIVLAPEESSPLFGGTGSSTGYSSAAASLLGLSNPSDRYVALMSIPSVEDEVVEALGLQKLYQEKTLSEARLHLEDDLQVKADSDSDLIAVSAVDPDPTRAATIANELVEAYQRSAGRMARTEAQRRRSFLEQQVAASQQRLSRSEEVLRKTKDRTGLLEVEGDTRALIGYESQLRAELSAKTVELASLKTNLSSENPKVQVAQREVQALEREASALKQGTGDKPATKADHVDASLAYQQKQRDVRLNESSFDFLLRNLDRAKLDATWGSSNLSIVSPATPPDMKFGPHRSIFLLAGLLIGALFSAAAVVVRLSFEPDVWLPGRHQP